jgi:hypothetical protein
MDLLREFNKKYLGQSDYDPAAASLGKLFYDKYLALSDVGNDIRPTTKLPSRFNCRCCGKSVHNSSSGGYNSLHEIMQHIPYVSIKHRLAKRLRLAYMGMVKEELEDFYFQDEIQIVP